MLAPAAKSGAAKSNPGSQFERPGSPRAFTSHLAPLAVHNGNAGNLRALAW
jgi:hypothetical protein